METLVVLIVASTRRARTRSATRPGPGVRHLQTVLAESLPIADHAILRFRRSKRAISTHRRESRCARWTNCEQLRIEDQTLHCQLQLEKIEQCTHPGQGLAAGKNERRNWLRVVVMAVC
jgi:hypothetical protein